MSSAPVVYQFNDRFGPSGGVGFVAGVPQVSKDALFDITDQELIDASTNTGVPNGYDDLGDYECMVREHSVVLKKAKVGTIVQVATRHSDPRVALCLAACKRREDNTPLFPGQASICELMYNNNSTQPNNALFSDGIRRASAALTAATLIARLSQVVEQHEHAKFIETQALADLAKICETFEPPTTTTTDDDATEKAACLFFAPNDYTVTYGSPFGRRLFVRFYAPWLIETGSTWKWVSHPTNGTDYLNAAQLANEISQAINACSLNNTQIQIVTTVQHAGELGLHCLRIYPRRSVCKVIAEFITVQIWQEADPNTAPSQWGPISTNLQTYTTNGIMFVLALDKSCAQDASGNPVEDEFDPTAIWFRNEIGSGEQAGTPVTGRLRFRVPPEYDVECEVTDFSSYAWMPAYAQVATALLDNMFIRTEVNAGDPPELSGTPPPGVFKTHEHTRGLGAIVRNDPFGEEAASMAAVKLIGWSVGNPTTHIVMDVLEIPNGVEMAVGNCQIPLTQFSRHPKSVRVPVQYSKDFFGELAPSPELENGQARIVRLNVGKPSLYKQICEEQETIFQSDVDWYRWGGEPYHGA